MQEIELDFKDRRLIYNNVIRRKHRGDKHRIG